LQWKSGFAVAVYNWINRPLPPRRFQARPAVQGVPEKSKHAQCCNNYGELATGGYIVSPPKLVCVATLPWKS